MEQLGHKVLFVCPTNKFVQHTNDSDCTLNQCFSVGMTDDETKNMKRFEDSSYDVIVFDETYLANITNLTRTKSYSETCPKQNYCCDRRYESLRNHSLDIIRK